jgi:glycine oxidase
MVDYIIVGAGLSGIAVIEELLKKGKTVRVFENNSQSSSTVAGGIYNPIILKRFTLAWQADTQLENAIPFYERLEKKLQVDLLRDLPIYRKFNSIEEQNDWFSAMDKPGVGQFLDSTLVKKINNNIPSDFSFGRVKRTGTINTELLIKTYKEFLRTNNSLAKTDFNYGGLKVEGEYLMYQNLKARRIIFCEGFGLNKNPFFSYLPLRGNKGEYIIIHAPELKLDVAVKSSVFVLPLGDDKYKIGATYDNQDTSPDPTVEAKEKLVEQVSKILKCDFEVVGHVAGIRPATPDRKPLVGQHPEFSNMYCCNGFGSRGVLIGPTVSKQLIECIEKGTELPSEINIQRFRKRY